MERLLRSSIEAFEPRLKGVKVAVSKKAGDVGRIRVSVSGVLTLENVREPLSFALVLSGAGATVAE
jgi:predicted component of type VI protein secretion system